MQQGKKSTDNSWCSKENFDKLLREHGINPPPKWGNKTGSLIMPAPKHSQSAKQQPDSQKKPKSQKDYMT